MRKDKKNIFELRKAGKSYREIQALTGISRGTLTKWFKGEDWSNHMRIEHARPSTTQLEHMHRSRSEKLAARYTAAEHEATVEYETLRNEPLFWAGLMIYASTGDQKKNGLIRITSSGFNLHKTFIAFLAKYLGVGRDRMRCGLLISPEHNESLCKEMWVNILSISREQFYKTQVVQGKGRILTLQYGIGMSILSSTVLKKKLSTWLLLAQDEKFEYAVMV